jgi:hypothetical protein
MHSSSANINYWLKGDDAELALRARLKYINNFRGLAVANKEHGENTDE